MDERGAGHTDGAGACTGQPQACVSARGQQQRRTGCRWHDGRAFVRLRETVLADPQGVRAVEIPKPKGGTRQLGIPSVVDRLIQ